MLSYSIHASTLQDVADIARVADDLEEVAYHWVPVSAQDCPPESRSLHELRTIWANSTKHLQTESIYSAREAKAAIEMAAIMAGGREELESVRYHFSVRHRLLDRMAVVLKQH
jgi:trimethylamine:corrinoid methyltransferase-like protein